MDSCLGSVVLVEGRLAWRSLVDSCLGSVVRLDQRGGPSWTRVWGVFVVGDLVWEVLRGLVSGECCVETFEWRFWHSRRGSFSWARFWYSRRGVLQNLVDSWSRVCCTRTAHDLPAH